MGVYVEKEWRYRKSKNASESAFSYKINHFHLSDESD